MTASTACRGATILVTGAGGFLGSRIAEWLVLEHGATVRVLLRSLAGASKIATLPLEYRRGDVTDLAAVIDAAKGCDVVMHCASRIEPGYSSRSDHNLPWHPDRGLRVLHAKGQTRSHQFLLGLRHSLTRPSWMKQLLIGQDTERTHTHWPRSPQSNSCNNAARIAASRRRYFNPQ